MAGVCMSLYETLTLLLLVVTAVISVVALVRTRRLEERQQRLRQLQEELTELQLQFLRREVEEQSRATVAAADVRVTLEGPVRNARFVITNWGYGAARNVNFTINQREGRSNPLVTGDYDEKLPIPELLPGDRLPLLAALTFGSGTTFDTVLTWMDDAGSEQRRQMQVSLT